MNSSMNIFQDYIYYKKKNLHLSMTSGHGIHELEFSFEYVPAGHFRHSLPGIGEYVPAEQL